MGDVVGLTFKEFWKTVFSPLPVEGGNDGVRARLLDRRDPDDEDVLEWLNTNTPGWSTEVAPKGARELDLPVGRDPVGTFLEFEASLLFRTGVHREAWRAREAAAAAEHARIRRRVEERRALVDDPDLVCFCCGGDTEPLERRETARLAQFGFDYLITGVRCVECGASSTSRSLHDPLMDAMDEAVFRVGLPDHGHPNWTDDIGKEWRRRRAAEPEITVHVAAGMTSEDILAQLDEALGQGGRRFGRPELVVLSEAAPASEQRIA